MVCHIKESPATFLRDCEVVDREVPSINVEQRFQDAKFVYGIDRLQE